MECPSSLPLVSQWSGRGVFIYLFIFHRDKRSVGMLCSYVIQYPLCMWYLLYVFSVCALQVFSNLDGVVQQRRQEMMESSSSGSQTPDYDKITGVCSILIPLCIFPSYFLWSLSVLCSGASCFRRSERLAFFFKLQMRVEKVKNRIEEAAIMEGKLVAASG